MDTEQSKTIIIAEIGTAHQGSFEKARALMDAARDAGADCVKFQWVYAHEILHPNTGFVNLPGGRVRLYDRFKELEVPPSFFARCRDYARSQGLLFMCSPFGLKSLAELWSLKPDAVKIASPELNHFPLLNELARLEENTAPGGRIPVVVSSGVSTMGDIEKALAVLQPALSGLSPAGAAPKVGQPAHAASPAPLKADPSAPAAARADTPPRTAPAEQSGFPALSLLHCITQYPAPPEEYNLRVLATLGAAFGIPCGVSDHSLNPSLVPAVSVACGGRLIEKHITLSKETDGLDDPVALTPEQFAEMVQSVRAVERTPQDERIPALNRRFGEETVRAVLGTGIKELAPSEKENYTRTNRSIHYMRAMRTGETITEKDIAVLRTEKVLTPGIPPEFYGQVVGKRLAVDVEDGSGLLWEHLA